MKISIGVYDATTGTVPVTFTEGEVIHTRPVNAVMKDGKYDKAATKTRVDEVGLGVAQKIAIGVISKADPASASPA